MHIQNCSIVPVNSEHAVKAVSFVCELGANLSTEKLQQIIAHYEGSSGLRNIFQKKTEGRSDSITVTSNGVDVKKNSGEISHVVFERIGTEDNVELALTVHANIINFSSNQYSRWANVSKEAFAILEEFVCFAMPDPGISVFGIQYVDEFIVTGDIASFRPSMLFDAKSKTISPNTFERIGPWHNHMGWFEDDNALQQDKVLHNLNINVVPQHEKLVVQIIGAHRYILSNPVSNKSLASVAMSEKFVFLHRKNVSVLKELLNKNALTDIHLEN